MADKEIPGTGLEDARLAMGVLQQRLESGEQIDEKELVMLSRAITAQIEKVRAALEEAVGSLDPDYVRDEMRKQLSPEAFEEWLAEQELKKSKTQEGA
jgi:hypothetical protein